MLVFAREGFLEVEDGQIEELFHSRTTVTLELPGAAACELKAVLCRYRAESGSVVQVAFHCRQLKRALLFEADPAAGTPDSRSLCEFLGALGFQLEPVNLNFTPALRQVVLKDIAGLASPAEARRQSSERAAMLAELEALIQKGPADSEAVKRAAHKLQVEGRFDKQAAMLRDALRQRLCAAGDSAQEHQALAAKTAELETRLQQALELAAEERQQREDADRIRLAAEARLQELEQDLVAAETRISSGLKALSRQEKQLAKGKKQLAETEAALEEVKAKKAELRATNQQLQGELARLRGELKSSTARIKAAEHSLNSTAKSAATTAQAAEKEVATLKEQGLALEQKLKSVGAELEKTRAECHRLAKSAAADGKRIAELEAELADSVRQRAGGAAATSAPAAGGHELQEVAARKIRELETHLEAEQIEVKKLSNALDLAIRKTMALEARLEEAATSAPEPRPAATPVISPVASPAAPAVTRKPLPHETRPAPKPGALFRPDWDLSGLPCRSAQQVLEAWGSVFNVQLALEGYQTQNCTAFVVVLKEGAHKRLYLLFELKKDRHVLVCVPGKPPRNEAELKDAVKQARDYLKISGFEIEKLPSESVAASLQKYFNNSAG